MPGSILEGGGQILRNAAALAAITGKSIHVDKIRAGWAPLVSCMTPLLQCAGPSECPCTGDHHVWHAATAVIYSLSNIQSSGTLKDPYMWPVRRSWCP